MKGLRKIVTGLLAGASMAFVFATAAAAQPAAPEAGKSPVVDQVRGGGVLRVGVVAYPPFILQNPATQAYSGPAADFVVTAAEGLGARIEWIPVNWDTMIAGLQAKQYEVLVSAIYATEARKAVVDFVNYTKSGVCYVARKDNGNVASLDDLKTKKLTMVAVSGASYLDQIKGLYANVEVTAKQAPPGAGNFFDEVLTERFDLTPVESLLTPQIEKAQPDLKVIPGIDDCIANPDFPADVGIAINKGDQAFWDYLNAVVTAAAPAVDAAIKAGE
jgi:polar amino acid transport system substrate-binding protein